MMDVIVDTGSGSDLSRKPPGSGQQDATASSSQGARRLRSGRRTRRTCCRVAIAIAGVLLGALLSVLVGALVLLKPLTQHNEQSGGNISSAVCRTADCRLIGEWFGVALNRSVRPCDDFYAHVCQSYRKGENPFALISEAINSIIPKSFHSAVVPKKGQTAWQKAAGLFQACLALANDKKNQISDLRGWMASLKLDLANLEPDNGFDAADAITTVSLEHNIPAFFQFDVSKTSFAHAKRSITLLLQDDLKGPDESSDDYMEDSSTFLSAVDCDGPYISRHLTAYGINSETIHHLTVSLEGFINKTRKILERWRNEEGEMVFRINALGNLTTNITSSDQWVAAFENHTDGMYGPMDQIAVRRTAHNVAADVAASPDIGKRGLRHLLAWRLFHSLFRYASGANMSCEYGCEPMCATLTLLSMDVAVMRHYQEIVAAGVIEKARIMLESVKTAFGVMLRKSSWLSGESREVALRKFGKMRFTVGYTENLPNASAVEAIYESMGDVDDRFVLSWARARRASTMRLLRDQHNIFVYSLAVNAYYYPSSNEIIIPPASIMPTLFFPNGPASVNYGALGATVGHEMMHGYDVTGMGIDDEGRHIRWGNKEAMQRYIDNAECIRKSHEKVDIKRRQLDDKMDSENLADFVGILAAYAAFDALPEAERNVQIAGNDDSGMTPERSFFLSYCASSCEISTESSEGYATGRGRCLVPVINSPAFARAFNCSPGDPMNPEIKCSFF